ncbi:hypothetical protein [Streptomyces prunicolor]|uniref:hypothetical protein n=1 Tax=Streptomyces prunicolor TaxID=67348 RepID=UPI00131A3A54|nr:hypothetical protein [Streptomyces prunicolor]
MDKTLQSAVTKVGKPTEKADGTWPDPEKGEWPSVTAIAVCGTDGCPVEGIGFQNTLYVQADGTLKCICGRCGVQIADLRGDLTPVGQDILEELKSKPKLWRQKVEDFKKKNNADTRTPK